MAKGAFWEDHKEDLLDEEYARAFAEAQSELDDESRLKYETVEWCDDCHRAVGIGCACKLTFAEKIRGIQVDKFGLMDMDRKRAEPKNRGLMRKTK